MEDQAQFYEEYWREIHEQDGLATVRYRIAEASGVARDVGLAYLKELEEKQEDERLSRQDEREEESLELARKASRQAEKAYHQSWVAIVIAGATALVSVAIALIND